MATVNKDFRVKNGLVVEGTTATVNGNDILTTASTISSDSITEGNSNLFFTGPRAFAAIKQAFGNGQQTNISFDFDTQSQTISVTAENGVADSSTDDLTEGSTNLYFTDARVVDAIQDEDISPASVTIRQFDGDIGNLGGLEGTLTLSSWQGGSDILLQPAQGQNVRIGNFGSAEIVATQPYVDSAIVTGINGIDTDDIEEGSANLYFTDARAVSAVTSLETLNFNNQAVQFSSGTNVYFLGDVYAADGADIFVDGSAVLTEGNTTDQLSEGTTNLYFTDARAVAAVENGTFSSITVDQLLTGNGFLTIDSGIGISSTQGNAYITVDGASLATETYVNTAVSNLVDSAPGALDTLNELAAALGDDANFSTTVTTAIGEKVAKSGDTMTGYLTLHANPESNLHAATKQYVDGAITTGINAIDTDAIEEGSTNLYYTDERVADLLRNATLTNISITGGGTGEELVITAENGVADSDTDDLAEGSTNLYFTDARVLSAIVDETIEPQIVTLKSNHPDNYSKTYILQHDNFEGGPQNLGEIAGSAAKIIVTAVNKNTGDIEVTEVLAAKAGGNVYVTEYANVTTGNDVGSVTVIDNGGLMQLNYTGANFDMLSVTAQVTDLIVDLT
jgi:hypothetical protein